MVLRATIKWDDKEPVATDQMIADTEKHLNHKLPHDFLEVARYHNAASPELTDFDFEDTRLGTVGANLGSLLSLDTRSPRSIVAMVDSLAGDQQLPLDIIPFASTGSGDLLCFDYRRGPAPTVVYWWHGRDNTNSVQPVSSSFSKFLGMLRPESDE